MDCMPQKDCDPDRDGDVFCGSYLAIPYFGSFVLLVRPVAVCTAAT